MEDFFQTGRKKRRGWFLRTLRALFNLTLVALVCAALALAGLYLYIVDQEGADLHARYPAVPENSYVYDRDGDEIGRFIGSEDRVTVSKEGLGEYLPDAVVAIEDRRFREHYGVDFEGLGRAAYTDVRAGQVEEGGSTITEQLMKNLFVPKEDRYRVSFWRRFVQACLAFSYERDHTKDEILTAYLNTVYYGDGAYGAEVASERYFGKSAKSLTLSESAALAGFLHAPSTYSVTGGEDSREKAVERRDEVLRLMRGQGMISPRQMRRAESETLDFAPKPSPDYSEYDPFLERVRREVSDDLGPGALKRGGLRIRTTLDPSMQREARASSTDTLDESGDPSAAVVSVEPQSGAIRAASGEAEGFNLAFDARRQPGSSFKPFVLADALKKNISPQSLYLSQDLDLSGDGKYVIRNYDYIERGPISLYDALAESDNTVFVRLGLSLGMESVVKTAGELGIESPLKPVPATAIGGGKTNVSPLEMASAYATLAARGVYREPYAVEGVRRVSFGREDSLYDHSVTGKRVLTGNQAAVATDALRGVVEYGTASKFRDLDEDLGKPSAGKTGTTDDYVDAWYVGYTPRLSTAVWVGYPGGNRSMVGVHGLDEAGGETLPLDLWADYMAGVTEGDPPLDFPSPDLSGLRVLDRSYYAATPVDSGSPEVALGSGAP